jgi:hypothetical protein
MKTEIIAEFKNAEDGITAVVATHVRGFVVALRDDGAGETLDTFYIFPTQAQAEAKAAYIARKI